MKHRKIHLAIGLLLIVLGSTALGGKTFSRARPIERSPAEGLRIELCRESEEEGSPVLSGEKAARRKLWVENTGDAPCYVRIRLMLPTAEETEILELGEMVGEEFIPLDFRQKEKRECWVRDGEYFYYRNPETENLLFPGETTLPVYSGIRQNQRLRGKLSSKVALELVAWAQAALPEEGKSEREVWSF